MTDKLRSYGAALRKIGAGIWGFARTGVRNLRAEFEIIRQRGFAQCVAELDRGICSVAALLAHGGPGALMSIGAMGPVGLFPRALREKPGPMTTAIARGLSGVLGWNLTKATKKSGSS